ncbi:gp53-like domain-containing protein [Burkholderia stagnalis]|uniref:gp53-like domain-containing protein n=1 Tax=Burkholderia stagnalis TaxID=1503054 RepID=UPI0007593855|nr:hypothetical protein [Burkholderia stagnalis]KVO53345.1 hypothetical protein WT18_26355 [Burkholderia stagnalis]KVP05601.1 hypothetical protein WT20_26845 [Burkholderia stagnalis]KVW99263.1 hypothetical protein WT30_02915 [Burkholderia stagnalis]KWH68027.1 hypothetical protein WT66_04710 [Burkholderia stagnalis]
MTDLVESSSWTPGIRQFETSDPVEGGPDGIDNVPLRQLANRTRFLKDRQEAHEGAVDPYPQYATKADLAQKVAALVDQSPEALNTLRELANALGNDPSFATTVTNALAQKAPIESPVFTGTPKGTTPAQFDSSTKLASTAFVQASLGNMRGSYTTSTSGILGAAQAGMQVYVLAPGTTQTINFAELKDGVRMIVYANYTAAGPTTLAINGSAKFVAVTRMMDPTITLNPGDAISFVVDASNINIEVTTANLRYSAGFGASLSPNGYQKLPSGLIIQWMTGAVVTANADNTIPFPIAFPNRVFAITSGVGYTNGSGQVNGYVSVSVTPTLSNFIARINGSTPSGVNFVALGN